MNNMSDPSNIKLKRIPGLHAVERKPIKSQDPEMGGSMSNGEYLRYLCNYTNPMIGPFIIQAINEFADQVIAKEEEILAEEKKRLEHDGSRESFTIPLISNELWIECAKFLRKQNYYHYEEGGTASDEGEDEDEESGIEVAEAREGIHND